MGGRQWVWRLCWLPLVTGFRPGTPKAAAPSPWAGRLRDAAAAALLSTTLVVGPGPASAAFGGFAVEDLPPQSQKVLLNQAGKLIFAADAYLFDVAEQLQDTSKWTDVLSQLQSASDPRFVSVSRVERDIVSPLRSLGQGIPEDAGGTEIDAAAQGLAVSMSKLTRVLGSNAVTVFDSAGARGSQVADATLKEALGYWEEGRESLNAGIEVVNALSEGSTAKQIGKVPRMTEAKSYKRGRDRYMSYKRDAAKCQQGGLGVNVCQSLMDKYTGAD